MSVTLLSYARGVSERVLHSLQSTWAFHQLRRRIDRLLTLAEDHQAAGIPNGDARFVELHRQALEQVNRYCATSGESRESLIPALPALSRLERLVETKTSSTMGVLVAIGTGSVVLGLALGLCHLAYSLLARLTQ